MLRRPSIYHAILLGDGCSSTAFGRTPIKLLVVWSNHATLGSTSNLIGVRPAVP